MLAVMSGVLLSHSVPQYFDGVSPIYRHFIIQDIDTQCRETLQELEDKKNIEKIILLTGGKYINVKTEKDFISEGLP